MRNVLNRKINQISDFSNFYFSSYAEKQCGRQFWNAVEREPVETRVLNTTASKARYKPKQCNYRKMQQFFFSYNFSKFHFSVIFVTSSPQFSMYFHDNLKNKNRRIFVLFFPFYSEHSAPFIITF